METNKIRVLEIQGTSGYGGSEIHTAQLVQALANDARFAVRLVIQPGGPVTRELRATGVVVDELDMSRKISWGTQRELSGIIQEFKPAIVHSHIRNADWHGCLAAWRCGCAWGTTIHDYINYDRYGRRTTGLAGAVYRVVLRRAAWRIGISADIARDTARELGLPDSAVEVIHNGSAAPPVETVALRSELRVPDETVLLGMVGRQTWQKGFAFGLRAVARAGLPAGCRLLMVGDGPLHRELRDAAQALGIADRTCWLPFRRDMPVFLKSLDLLLVPSRWEAFGRIITEAQAAECAVVAASVGGIPEVVGEDGGLLFAPDDVEDCAAKIAELVNDQRRRKTVAAAAAARWQRNFTRGRFQRKTLDFLIAAATQAPRCG